MLSDRDYMREGRYRTSLPVWGILMICVVVAFMVQQISHVYLRWPAELYLALSPLAITRGWIWQFLTYQFMHAGLWHLTCNLIGLWCFGRFVEHALGAKRLLFVYFGAGLLGGVLQVLLMWAFPKFYGTWVSGASASVLGLLAVFALLEPEREILLMFILPVKAKWLLVLSLGIAMFFTVVPSDPGVAHAAHLGGLLAGVLFVRLGWHRDFVPLPGEELFDRLRRALRRKPVPASVLRAPRRAHWQAPVATAAEPADDAEFISREVDPILDKIAAHGMQSLTERERKTLEAARHKMAKR